MIANKQPYYHDFQYFNLIKKIINNGVEKQDRTGTGTTSVPFEQMSFPLDGGSIPLLTTKKMFVKGVIYELLWYIRGDRNIKFLNDHGVHIWDNWADQDGDLGPVYGAQWRNWIGLNDNGERVVIDQLADVINRLRTNPLDRRIILSSWNVAQLSDMNLPPCHCLLQFWSDGQNLQSHLYQRSCDVGLGVPFNIVQYSILTHMIGQVTNLTPTKFVWTGGDCHIYNNHRKALWGEEGQIFRTPSPSPFLNLNTERTELEQFTFDDFSIINYNPHPAIKMKVST